jgi:hypothetical protein
VKKNPFKQNREQALNDSTSGQLGEEPSDLPKEVEAEEVDIYSERKKMASKLSKNVK